MRPHVTQFTINGRVHTFDEYAAIETTFDPNALAEMTEWIRATALAAPAKQIPESSRPAGWNAAPLPARRETNP